MLGRISAPSLEPLMSDKTEPTLQPDLDEESQDLTGGF
jgi:hypothetical protein